jgi:hypothetical protein
MDGIAENADLVNQEEPPLVPSLKSALIIWACCFLFAVAPAGLTYIAEHAAYWPQGTISPEFAFAQQFYMVFTWLFSILCFVVSFVVLLVIVVALLFRSNSRWLQCICFATLFLLAGSLISVFSPFMVRIDFVKAFTPVAERGQAIIDAVEAYHNDRGTYPDCVEEFVPAYLKEMPKTGLAGYPDFKYRKGDDTIPYVVSVDTPRGGLNWDQFIDWPTGDYDKHYWGGWIEPVGKWVYFHE